MIISGFISSNKKEIAATFIVVAFFLFFWINGPIFKQLEIVSIESIETKYSNPKLLNDKENNYQKKFNTIAFEEEKNDGSYNLIDNKEKEIDTYKVLSKKNDYKTNKTILNQLSKHLNFILSDKNEYSFELINNYEIPFLLIKDKTNQLQYIYLETNELLEHIKGYAGPIKIGVLINKNGLLEQVKHISSKETESYLWKIKNKGYYQQYNTVSIDKGEQIVDAVSGATLTSQAISKTVSELINYIYPNPLDTYVDVDGFKNFEVEAKLNKLWILHICIICLIFLYGLNKRLKKSKRQVIILSILSVIYIGFFLNNSFTYITFLHPFFGTSVSMFTGLYALMVLLGAIWGKNTYCKYVCPFGNIQRIIIHINPLKTSRKFFISNLWTNRIRGSITIILLTGVLLGLRSWSNFELYPDLFGLSVFSVWFVVAVITVLSTMVYPMIWCRLLCPTGSILDTISKFTSK
ncbi:MAG: hypothetical protein Kow0079_11320 [Vicingaceae bacterium]